MSDPIINQIANAIVAVIRGLNLDGIDEREITARKVPTEDTRDFRGITVSWEPERESRGTNLRDDIGYPFLITICRGSAKGNADEMVRTGIWRQRIRRALHSKRLGVVSSDGTDEICCMVQHRDPSLPKEYIESHDVSQLIVTSWFRESRAIV